MHFTLRSPKPGRLSLSYDALEFHRADLTRAVFSLHVTPRKSRGTYWWSPHQTRHHHHRMSGAPSPSQLSHGPPSHKPRSVEQLDGAEEVAPQLSASGRRKAEIRLLKSSVQTVSVPVRGTVVATLPISPFPHPDG